jgi:nitrous oxidase accessory protein
MSPLTLRQQRFFSSLRLCLFLSLILFAVPLWAADSYPSFQKLVDAAEPNAVLVPEPGTYAGPVTIDKPLTIDGQGKVIIDAGGKGSVVYLDTDGVTLKNLHLTNSGESHNDIDSGVQVRGNFNVIRDNIIDNSLFGVDLQQSENNIVRNNRISSKDFDLGLRGDAVRLWYSFNNKITGNIIRDSRDMVVWYSKDNVIANNDARGGRYSLHFMYSQYNEVIGNHYENNTVGIFLMYSDGVVVKDNYIAHAIGPTGMGIGFKETSDVVVENNQVLYCATGLYLDVSPYQPDTTNHIRNNLIAYSGLGILFLNDWTGHVFEGNALKGNITQVAVSGGKTANRNVWKGNYWDDFEGFDQDRDQVGDSAYELYNYADRIWMDVPYARFFKGSPVLEVLDFLERLAPFTDPDMILRDEKPLMVATIQRKRKDLTAPVAESAGEEDAAETPTEKASGEPEPFDALKALRESVGR